MSENVTPSTEQRPKTETEKIRELSLAFQAEGYDFTDHQMQGFIADAWHQQSDLQLSLF